MNDQNKKLTPMKFLPDVQQMPWGTVEYKLADLGFVDSMACEGWLKGNTLSDIMQTYLERVVGETAFEWYGTQFPVLVKRLEVKGRSSLHVNPDDETAEQRYDAFGKTALWYVEEAGPNARLYLGFKRPVTAEAFYKACLAGKVESLLHCVRPVPGETYLIRPGQVHAAKDVTLLEVAEASELWFRLHDWNSIWKKPSTSSTSPARFTPTKEPWSQTSSLFIKSLLQRRLKAIGKRTTPSLSTTARRAPPSSRPMGKTTSSKRESSSSSPPRWEISSSFPQSGTPSFWK